MLLFACERIPEPARDGAMLFYAEHTSEQFSFEGWPSREAITPETEKQLVAIVSTAFKQLLTAKDNHASMHAALRPFIVDGSLPWSPLNSTAKNEPFRCALSKSSALSAKREKANANRQASAH